MHRPAVPPGLLLAAALLLAGCAGGGPAAEAPLEIAGTLTYRQRIALPPAGTVVVELRRQDGPAVAESRAPLAGRQVPIPFALQVARDRLAPGADYAVSGAVLLDGGTVWASEPQPVDTGAARLDLGALLLFPQQGNAFSTVLRCGETEVRADPASDGLHVDVAGERFVLEQVPAASGARYALPDDPTTEFWSKGREATLRVRGRVYPTCAEVAAQPEAGPAALQGAPWTVERVGDVAVAGPPQPTLEFAADGRVAGNAGCNGYGGEWRLEGERLALSRMVSTMRACAPGPMATERRFLEALARVERFRIAADGVLHLEATGGGVIVARRP